MSDEAEEFKRQKERLDANKNKFCALYEIPEDRVEALSNITIYGEAWARIDIISDNPKDDIPLFASLSRDGDGFIYGETEAEALRALNDRLELALQGKMTTEAEEFKQQEERFQIISNDFYSGPDDNNILSYGIYQGHRGYYTALCYIGVIFAGEKTTGETALQALRALNDRLELASQGKVKGE